jgi:two-component system cell cycle sensor histidine kinase/response regulator CckA
MLRGKKMILIIDDEEGILEVASRSLTKAGLKTLRATNGEEGIDLYRQHLHEVALVVLDMFMPGLSGFDMLAMLTGINPDVRILVSSGSINEATKQNLLSMGAVGFIAKPYTPYELIEAIQETIQSLPDKVAR